MADFRVMSNYRIKDSHAMTMDKIWVCDECNKTYAGGVAMKVTCLNGHKKNICLYCRDKREYAEYAVLYGGPAIADFGRFSDSLRGKYTAIYGEEPENN